MKKLFIAALAAGCFTFFASSTGCRHDDTIVTPDSTNNGNSNGTPITITPPTSGTWIVSLFTEHGVNETSDFDGYTFDFQSGGVFTATRNGQTTTGNWLQKRDDNKNKFVITITSADHHIEGLSEDWIIVSSTGTELDLGDDNTGHSETLHFTRQ